jgi:hypothetical protein
MKKQSFLGCWEMLKGALAWRLASRALVLLVCSMFWPELNKCLAQEDFSSIYSKDLFSPQRRQAPVAQPDVLPEPFPPPQEAQNTIVLRGIVEIGGVRRACLTLQDGTRSAQALSPSGENTTVLGRGETTGRWVVEKVQERSVELVDKGGQRLHLSIYDVKTQGTKAKGKKQAVGLLTKPDMPPPPPIIHSAPAQTQEGSSVQVEGETPAAPEATTHNHSREEESLAEEISRQQVTKGRKLRGGDGNKRREGLSGSPAPPPIPSELYRTTSKE